MRKGARHLCRFRVKHGLVFDDFRLSRGGRGLKAGTFTAGRSRRHGAFKRLSECAFPRLTQTGSGLRSFFRRGPTGLGDAREVLEELLASSIRQHGQELTLQDQSDGTRVVPGWGGDASDPVVPLLDDLPILTAPL